MPFDEDDILNTIRLKDIRLGFLMLCLTVVFIFAGMVSHWMFLPAAGFAVAYARLDKKHLRCPNCGGFINMDRLLAAAKSPRFCEHCGKRITIEK